MARGVALRLRWPGKGRVSGASLSGIDEDFAVEIGARPVDRKPLAGIAGTQEHNVYHVHIWIKELNKSVDGQAFGVSLPTPGPRVIVGRNFLADKIFIYDGKLGLTTIAD